MHDQPGEAKRKPENPIDSATCCQTDAALIEQVAPLLTIQLLPGSRHSSQTHEIFTWRSQAWGRREPLRARPQKSVDDGVSGVGCQGETLRLRALTLPALSDSTVARNGTSIKPEANLSTSPRFPRNLILLTILAMSGAKPVGDARAVSPAVPAGSANQEWDHGANRMGRRGGRHGRNGRVV